MKAARLLVLFVVACSLGSPDRERLGDKAWHEARWADALASYRAAGDSPRLTAKVADAALQGGWLSESAQAWIRLAAQAPERAGEAAAGLAEVADVAEHDGRPAALAEAVAGLRLVAPGWPLGRFASRLGGVGAIPSGQMTAVIPALLAAATDRATTEPLLLALGQADRARGACELAVPILEGVLRRTTIAGLHDSAATVLGSCELGLGLSALQASRLGTAERWLDRAARRDPGGAVGRRALVGLGDARLQQGDTATARLAWQELVIAGGLPDSLTQLALLRLQPGAPATVPDSSTPRPAHP